MGNAQKEGGETHNWRYGKMHNEGGGMGVDTHMGILRNVQGVGVQSNIQSFDAHTEVHKKVVPTPKKIQKFKDLGS